MDKRTAAATAIGTEMIISPLTGQSNVEKVGKLATRRLADDYQKNFGVDIGRFVQGLEEIGLYRCQASGLGFYVPATVCGDGAFYAQLQQQPWYYMDDKWEYEAALRFIHQSDAVLELGSGKGAFLKKASAAGAKAVGLELNTQAAAQSRAAGLDARCEDIQAHAAQHAGAYDVVCSFQVMEHVAEPRAILEASVQCLRPGGRLLMAVPDNGGFLKAERAPVLNAPPHHLLRWNRQSLEYLAKILPLKVQEIVHEPLQLQHYAYFLRLMAEASPLGKSRLKRRLFFWLLKDLQPGVAAVAEGIHGHTILGCFVKDASC